MARSTDMMQLLIELRQTARGKKDFATSDTIRDRLGASRSRRWKTVAGGTEWTQGLCGSSDSGVRQAINFQSVFRQSGLK